MDIMHLTDRQACVFRRVRQRTWALIALSLALRLGAAVLAYPEPASAAASLPSPPLCLSETLK